MQEPMRVLQVLGSLCRGGAETMVMNIYRSIDTSRLQFDFVIHTLDDCAYREEIEALGGKVFTMPSYRGYNHIGYKKAWKKFFMEQPEYKVIHGHMRSTAAIYLSIAKKFGLITIAHSHSTKSRGNPIERVTKNLLQRPIRHLADYFYACSTEAGDWLFGKCAVKGSNFKLLNNAIDPNCYSSSITNREEIRNRLGITNSFVVGHVGAFNRAKNHSFILEVFLIVLQERPLAKLLLVGTGPLKEEIENRALSLGILDRIIFAGSVPRVNEYLSAMDVFLFPSLWEGLPLALIEAQAAGLPCITSDAVTMEVCITPLVRRLSLGESKTIWAREVLNSRIPENLNVLELIDKAGFNVLRTSRELSTFYLGLQANCREMDYV